MTATATMIRDEIAEAVPVLHATPIRPQAPVYGVRPLPKVAGRYQEWDVLDASGRVVRRCSDLFDAMMWIQDRAACDPSTSVIDRPAIGSELTAIDACD